LKDLRTILTNGIEAIVDLAIAELPELLTRDIAYIKLPLPDSTGNMDWTIRIAVATVYNLLVEEVPTLVCCDAGMSRSPCIVAAALGRIRSVSIENGLEIVHQTGPIDVSPGFLSEVKHTLARFPY